MSKVSRYPKKCRVMDGNTTDAWWYENPHNIEVHVEIDGSHAVLRIVRSQLKSWLDRTEPQP
jgi:hypothetical protein